MIIKALFIILLLICVGVQGMFIYLLGGYDPHELNKLLRMWESFGIALYGFYAVNHTSKSHLANPKV